MNSSGRSGLTLIEVMLALAIMLLSLSAIGHLTGIGSDRGFEARMMMRGTRLAESKMAEVEVGAIKLDAASGGGNFEGDDKAWSWSCEVQPAGPPNLFQVTVKVSRDVRGTPFEISIGRMLFDPSLVGSAAQAERPAESEAADPLGMGGTTP